MLSIVTRTCAFPTQTKVRDNNISKYVFIILQKYGNVYFGVI